MREENSISILLVFLHLVAGINVEFENGNLIFDWGRRISTAGPFDVIITLDSQSSEITVNNTSFVVNDVTNFSTVSISVKEQKNRAITYNNRTFEVALLSSSSGYDKVIHWEMPYFPKSGNIRIFHEQRPNEPIFHIKDQNVLCTKPHKYKYMSIPVNSVFVTFTIINTTLNDAGFYYDKIISFDNADAGAFLLIYDKPTRPTIYGQTEVKIGELVNLTCYSRSTSIPTYYKQFPQLRFTWFLNGTEVPSVRGGVFVFTAMTNHRFIPITCQSTEIESSEMSDIFLLDVIGNDKYVTTSLTPTIGTTTNQISTSEAFLTGRIQVEFEGGNLIFDWGQTISTAGPFDVIITLDSQSSEMFTVNNKSFVVHDVMNFSTVSISVKEQKGSAIKYNNRTFQVGLFTSSIGNDKFIYWEMPYFPMAGNIDISHEQRKRESIFEIVNLNVFCTKPHKYKYMSIPVNSVFVNFTIINTTLNDAGFYYDKIHLSDDADAGACLVVYGKPTRPTIYGQSKVTVGELVNLTCYSRSMSTPIYYKQFPQLMYTWFINGTVVPSVRGDDFVFTVTKNHRFIPITCQSTEIESSQMSDIFFIDVVGNDEYFTKPLTTITTTRNSISTTERFLTDENYLRMDSGDEMNIMVIIIVFLTSVIIILITWILFIKLKGGNMCKKNLKRKTLSSQYLTPSVDSGDSSLSIIYNRDGADHYHQINEDSTSYIYIDF